MIGPRWPTDRPEESGRRSGKGVRPWPSWGEVWAVPGMPVFGLPLALPSLCPRGPGDSLEG